MPTYLGVVLLGTGALVSVIVVAATVAYALRETSGIQERWDTRTTAEREAYASQIAAAIPETNVIAGASSPAVPDSDNDGIDDALEGVLNTGPHNPDTDGDGIPDGQDPTPTDGGTTSPPRPRRPRPPEPPEPPEPPTPPEPTPPSPLPYIIVETDKDVLNETRGDSDYQDLAVTANSGDILRFRLRINTENSYATSLAIIDDLPTELEIIDPGNAPADLFDGGSPLIIEIEVGTHSFEYIFSARVKAGTTQDIINKLEAYNYFWIFDRDSDETLIDLL
ncbi:MAG: hypothetical protein V1826_02285 [bacterium]